MKLMFKIHCYCSIKYWRNWRHIGYFILVIEHIIELHYKLDGIHQKSSIILLMLYAIQSFQEKFVHRELATQIWNPYNVLFQEVC